MAKGFRKAREEPEEPGRLVPLWTVFVRSVAILAQPADGQILWLESLDIPSKVDEPGLEFTDQFLLSQQFQSNGWMSREVVDLAWRIDQQILRMSGKENADLWTYSALREAPAWEEVRRLSLSLLIEL